MMLNTTYYADCRYFKGDLPCKPHKKNGLHCEECKEYAPTKGIVLVVKLGAIGDVIRTTPLIARIKREYPTHSIWWITQSPQVLPESVDKILPFNDESLLLIQVTNFDTVINLDKAPEACAIASLAKSTDKRGFVLLNGVPAPANSLAVHKFVTGIFDDISKANTKSYLQEIFEICGWEFGGEEYELPVLSSHTETKTNERLVVGLNTGCGARWTSRLWDIECWIQLAKKLIESGYGIVLLGGPQEHERNTIIAERTGAEYGGYFPMDSFITLVDQCDVVVTGVTMALHIAIGLKKQVVVMNNIFNRYEFELYGRGEIVEPEKECKCYYGSVCTNSEYRCIEHLSVESVFNAVQKLADAVVIQ